jgi:microcystin-dependent protein
VVGETGGAETVTLTTAQLPPHSHLVAPLASNDDANSMSPTGKVPATKARTTLYTDPVDTTAMAATTTSSTGGGQPVGMMPPYQTLNCVIAAQGIYPSRD